MEPSSSSKDGWDNVGSACTDAWATVADETEVGGVVVGDGEVIGDETSSPWLEEWGREAGEVSFRGRNTI